MQTQICVVIVVSGNAHFSVQPSSWLLKVASCSLSSTRGWTQVTLNIWSTCARDNGNIVVMMMIGKIIWKWRGSNMIRCNLINASWYETQGHGTHAHPLNLKNKVTRGHQITHKTEQIVMKGAEIAWNGNKNEGDDFIAIFCTGVKKAEMRYPLPCYINFWFLFCVVIWCDTKNHTKHA